MKRLLSIGIGQAEPLTHGDVDILLENKLLGDTTPQSLLDTIVFLMLYTSLYEADKSIAN